MHGKQLAVVLVELLALHGQIADLPPMLLKGFAALTRAAGQQATHAHAGGFQPERRQHLTATLGTRGNGFDADGDLQVDAVDFRA